MKREIPNPFHEGERVAQERAGAGDVSQWAGGYVRDHLPEQHRNFHRSLPFLVLSGADEDGRVWTTLVEGKDGFIRSPDPRWLTLDAAIDPTDPLAGRFALGGEIGGLGIELATRRRNRFSGWIAPDQNGLAIVIGQAFGNCPQYIHPRASMRVPRVSKSVAMTSDHLTKVQIAQVEQADTMFIGSGHHGRDAAASNGYDASHRGGPRGFVHVAGPKRLQVPDYAGNNFFNTIGNILSNPRVGLLFVDFENGSLLHISGQAQIDWSPRDAHDPDARRMITVDIDKVVTRPGAVSLRWEKLDAQLRKLRLERREEASVGITSFYLVPVDGRPLDPFKPGQHLPISAHIPGPSGLTDRSYSLSGAPSDTGHYRLSVKREDQGLMSRFLHDQLRVGDLINTRPPAGDFVIPDGDGPVVLVSAGVGLTPMVSMLHALAGRDRPVWYMHAARNGQHHALRREVQELVAQHANLQRRVHYSQPAAGDRLGRDFDASGRITARDLIDLVVGDDANYMLCGPSRFIAELRSGLEEAGTPPGQIHSETFGPGSPV